jgi:hypothetical protein
MIHLLLLNRVLGSNSIGNVSNLVPERNLMGQTTVNNRIRGFIFLSNK